MNLELKHLAPYLPYKLRIKRIDYEHKNLFLLGIYFYDVVHQLGRTPFDFIKPILRPISEINSKHHSKFRENYYIDFDNSEGLMVKRINETYTRFNELDYLFENHFDVFGLIEKGLAISIHDVEQADA